MAVVARNAIRGRSSGENSVIVTAEGRSQTDCAPRLAVSNAGIFGAKGGTLIFGASRLIIPGGALRSPVLITATVPANAPSRVEFQPEGLQFFKAAGLQLDASGCNIGGGGVPNVVYLSPTGVVLETIQAVYDPVWHTIAAPISHFSGYAIAF